VPSRETKKTNPEHLPAVSRPIKADLATVVRVMTGSKKTFHWECYYCWVVGECCPNYCPQNC